MKATTAPSGIYSMTGFAQGRVEQDGGAVRINLRSVNHRFLDLHLRMPDGFEVFESRIRQAIRNKLRRGHVDVNVYYEAVGAGAVEVNHELVASYMKAVERLRKEFGVKTEPDLVALLRLPGVVAASGSAGQLQSEEEQEKLGKQVDACLEQALNRLETMRRSEGQALTAEMQRLLGQIATRTAEIETFSERVRPIIARRLEERLGELLKGVQVDPLRLAQEAAILAERRRRQRGAGPASQPRGAVSRLALRSGRGGQETRFSFAGDAARSQHVAVQDAGCGIRRPGHHWPGAGSKIRYREAA